MLQRGLIDRYFGPDGKSQMSGRLLLLVLSVLLLNPSTAETQAVGPETAVSASYKYGSENFPPIA
jgi:hypothetical protein